MSQVAEQLDRIALADPEIPDADKAALRVRAVRDWVMAALTPEERRAVRAADRDPPPDEPSTPSSPRWRVAGINVNGPARSPLAGTPSLWNAAPRGALQLIGNAYSLGAAAADLPEAGYRLFAGGEVRGNPVSDYLGSLGEQAETASAELFPKVSADLATILKRGGEGFGTWFAENLLEQVPMIGASVVGGSAAGAAKLGKLEKLRKLVQLAAYTAPTQAEVGGGAYGEMLDRGTRRRPGMAALAGAIGAGLEAIPGAHLMKKLGVYKPFKQQVIRNVARDGLLRRMLGEGLAGRAMRGAGRVVGGGLVQGAEESLTEMPQELVQLAAVYTADKDKALFGPEFVKEVYPRMFEAGGAAFGVGLFTGGVGGAVSADTRGRTTERTGTEPATPAVETTPTPTETVAETPAATPKPTPQRREIDAAVERVRAEELEKLTGIQRAAAEGKIEQATAEAFEYVRDTTDYLKDLEPEVLDGALTMAAEADRRGYTPEKVRAILADQGMAVDADPATVSMKGSAVVRELADGKKQLAMTLARGADFQTVMHEVGHLWWQLQGSDWQGETAALVTGAAEQMGLDTKGQDAQEVFSDMVAASAINDRVYRQAGVSLKALFDKVRQFFAQEILPFVKEFRTAVRQGLIDPDLQDRLRGAYGRGTSATTGTTPPARTDTTAEAPAPAAGGVATPDRSQAYRDDPRWRMLNDEVQRRLDAGESPDPNAETYSPDLAAAVTALRDQQRIAERVAEMTARGVERGEAERQAIAEDTASRDRKKKAERLDRQREQAQADAVAEFGGEPAPTRQERAKADQARRTAERETKKAERQAEAERVKREKQDAQLARQLSQIEDRIRKHEDKYGYDRIDRATARRRGKKQIHKLAERKMVALQRDKDTTYQQLLKKRASLRGQRTKLAAQETRDEAAAAVRQGTVTEETIPYAPVHTLPEAVRQPIQQAAEWLLSTAKPGSATARALEKIIKDAGSDVGAAVEQQKERIVKYLSGDAERGPTGPNEPPPPADPVIELLTSERRAQFAAESVESIDRGEPDEAATAVARRLYDAVEKKPEGADPDEYLDEARAFLQQIAEAGPPDRRYQAGPKDLFGREITEPNPNTQKQMDFERATTGEQPIADTTGGKRWLNKAGRIEFEDSPAERKRMENERAREGQQFLFEGEGSLKPPELMTYSELREAVTPGDRSALAAARPLLRQLYADKLGDDRDPWGLARAVERGDELPRTPTVDLSQRHRRAIGQALAQGKPVSAAAVDGYGMTVPDGYIRKADRYIAGDDADMRYQTGWHASPHTFDRLSTEHMGEGLGAQSEGWGLYFSSARAYAQHLRNRWGVGQVHYKGKPWTPPLDAQAMNRARTLDELSAQDYALWTAYRKQSAYEAEEALMGAAETYEIHGDTKEHEAAAAALKWLRENMDDVEVFNTQARLYEADLRPDPDEYLDWQAPYSRQSPKVQAVLRKLFPDLTDSSREVGGQLYRRLAERLGSEKAASLKLRSLGVRGNTYFEPNHVYEGEGERNYVIFDDADVEIRARYQLRPASEAGATSDAQVERARRAWARMGTDSPYFKRYFGTSKVVDADGEPLPLYHQTSKENEKSIYDSGGFRLDRPRARRSDDSVPDGVFFKPDARDIGVGAVRKADVAQMAVYVSLENPLIVENRDELRSSVFDDAVYRDAVQDARLADKNTVRQYDKAEAAFQAIPKEKRTDEAWKRQMALEERILREGRSRIDASATRARARMTNILKDRGYDGVIIKDDVGSFNRRTTTYIAFRPEQIKSATGNRGTFDAENPDIRYQARVEDQAGRIHLSSQNFRQYMENDDATEEQGSAGWKEFLNGVVGGVRAVVPDGWTVEVDGMGAGPSTYLDVRSPDGEESFEVRVSNHPERYAGPAVSFEHDNTEREIATGLRLVQQAIAETEWAAQKRTATEDKERMPRGAEPDASEAVQDRVIDPTHSVTASEQGVKKKTGEDIAYQLAPTAEGEGEFGPKRRAELGTEWGNWWYLRVENALKSWRGRGEVDPTARIAAGLTDGEKRDLTVLGANRVMEGFTSFGKWKREMANRYGEKITPYLGVLWTDSRLYANQVQAKMARQRRMIWRDLTADNPDRWGSFTEEDLNGPHWSTSELRRSHAIMAQCLARLAPFIQDIHAFSAGMRDLHRNIRRAFGKHWPKAKRLLLDPFDRAKGEYVRTMERMAAELKRDMIDGFGIQKGSEMSKILMRFAEREEGFDRAALETLVGPEQARTIIQAEAWLRKRYDEMWYAVNAMRAQIYPNDATKRIPYRDNYMRHWRERSEGWGQTIQMFEQANGIPSEMSMLSPHTQPRSKFLSFAQKRLGHDTEIDAVGGYIDYAKAWAYAVHIDPQIGAFRELVKELVVATSDEGAAPRALPRLIPYLVDVANDLAGKTGKWDRAVMDQGIGRETLGALSVLTRRTKMNIILGKLSSAVAQAANLPNGMAVAGWANGARGIGRTLATVAGTPNAAMNQSAFLAERYFNAWDQFDTGMLNSAKKFAAWITQALDEVGTKVIWNSMYEKALQEGQADPVGYADGLTREMVAGRGIGEVPLTQKQQLFQLFAPFQIEVGNVWHVLHDRLTERQFGALLMIFVYNWLFNRGAEWVRGSGVTLDPIQAMIDATHTLVRESQDPWYTRAKKAAFRLGGEVLSNFPAGQTVAAMGWDAEDRKKWFGREDPTRFGTSILAARGISDPLFKLLPPFGGDQIKRTLQGALSLYAGEPVSKPGREMGRRLWERLAGTPSEPDQWPKFAIPATPGNVVRSLAFGPYATAQGREWSDQQEPGNSRYQQLIRALQAGDRKEAQRLITQYAPGSRKGVYSRAATEARKRRARQRR